MFSLHLSPSLYTRTLRVAPATSNLLSTHHLYLRKMTSPAGGRITTGPLTEKIKEDHQEVCLKC